MDSLLTIVSFCPWALFVFGWRYMFCITSKATDNVTSLLSRSIHYLYQTSCINHTINTDSHTYRQSVTMATPPPSIAHTHRKQMGQWFKMYMLFHLFHIQAIVLVSCSGRRRHERARNVNELPSHYTCLTTWRRPRLVDITLHVSRYILVNH